MKRKRSWHRLRNQDNKWRNAIRRIDQALKKANQQEEETKRDVP